jgi:hypothetical protein
MSCKFVLKFVLARRYIISRVAAGVGRVGRVGRVTFTCLRHDFVRRKFLANGASDLKTSFLYPFGRFYAICMAFSFSNLLFY